MRIVVGLVGFALAVAAPPAAADGIPAVLQEMTSAYARVHAYTARFIRTERVGGMLRPREEALLKFQRPGRIYLKWTAGPPEGREILFVEGRDDDRILVHEPGAFSGLFTVLMAPDSPWVLKESRHPVTDVGLGRLIELILGNAERARRDGGLTVVERPKRAEPSSRERRYELTFPRDPRKGYYCHRALVSVDLDSGLPVAATIFDRDDVIVADYAYRDLRLNPELGPIDFDPSNPEYGFPRWRLRW